MTKTILFITINAPGHINASVGIADQLKLDHGFKSIFVLIGSMVGSNITDHGHQLITIEETSFWEDYEIDPNEETWPAKISDEEAQLKGLKKKQFPGAKKWPQLIARHSPLLRNDPVDSYMTIVNAFYSIHIKLARDYDEDTGRIIDEVNPNLIIVDDYLIWPAVLKRKHIPWVRFVSANPFQVIKPKKGAITPPGMCGMSLYTKEERERMRREEPETWKLVENKWSGANEKLASQLGDAMAPVFQIFKDSGVELPPTGRCVHESNDLNLYLFPKELDYDKDDDLFEYPPRWLRCDALMQLELDESSEQLSVWSDRLNEAMKGKKEMIFFSLGSIASGNVRLMKHYIEILRQDQDRLYVVSKGANGDQYDLDRGNMIGGNYIPQTYFLKKANMAIIHGGNNSITECMYYGVPIIVLPAFGDQVDNARRIEDLGLGKTFNLYTCNGEQLSKAVDEILADRVMSNKLKEIGERMRSRNDIRKVSYVLRKFLDEGKISEEFVNKCNEKDFDELKHELE